MLEETYQDALIRLDHGYVFDHIDRPRDIWTEFNIVIGCVCNCSFCPQTLFVKRYYTLFGPKAPRLLSYKDFCIILKKLPKGSTVVFAGNSEPFMNPECTEMILEADRTNHPVTICTTFTGLTPQNLSKILQAFTAHYDRLTFNIHIPSEEKIEHIRVNDNYLKTLDCLLESHLPIDFHYHGSHPDPIVAQRIRKAGYPISVLQLISRANNILGPNITPAYFKWGKLTCHDITLKRRLVQPNGSVFLCSMEFGLRHYLGNLITSSYSSIHRSKEYKKILKGLNDASVKTLCRTCQWANTGNDAISEIHNTHSRARKISLGVKMYLYDHAKPLYNSTRFVYHKALGIPNNNDPESFFKQAE